MIHRRGECGGSRLHSRHQSLLSVRSEKGGSATLEKATMEKETSGNGLAQPGKEQERVRFALSQHAVLRKTVGEDVTRLEEGELEEYQMKETIKAVAEGRILEERLQKAERARIQSLTPLRQVLQTRVVGMDEVRMNPERWHGPFLKEYQSLTTGPVKTVTRKQVEEMRMAGRDMEILPTKGVATEKPSKDKARIVACGNYSQLSPENEISVRGANSAMIRALVHRAAGKRWALGSIDVAGAFLQAPRRSSRITIVEPPQVLKHLGIIGEDEMWEVQCALYGFQESPADWSDHRDKTLTTMTWEEDGKRYSLKETEVKHLWHIKEEGNKVVGLLTTYVDDMLAGAEDRILRSFFKTVKATWKCSGEEYAAVGSGMRYCGFDIWKMEDGGYLHNQRNYLENLMQKREITKTEPTPMNKVEEGPDEEVQDPEVKKLAQALTGELMLVSGRTRPDIGFAVGVMSRMLHRRPAYIVQVGYLVMRYLRGTTDLGLHYRPGGDKQTVNIYVDASFAPPHEGYRSIQGAVIEHAKGFLSWESGRQLFIITQSTAESELLAMMEGFQVGQSTISLLEAIGFQIRAKTLHGDNKAALIICTSEVGSWRTRHLRIRSAKLREVLAEAKGQWKTQHCPGDQLVADGMTKPLQGAAFSRFQKLLHLAKPEEKNVKGQDVKITNDHVESEAGKAKKLSGLWQSQQGP